VALFKRKRGRDRVGAEGGLVAVEHGEMASLPGGCRITAVEAMVLRLPRAAFPADAPMADVMAASESARFGMDDDDPEAVLVRLEPGEWAEPAVAMGCQVFFDTERAGSVRIKGPGAPGGYAAQAYSLMSSPRVSQRRTR